MPRVSELLGLPVMSADGSRRLGRVQDLLLDPQGHRVQGVVLGRGGWLRPQQAVGWADLVRVGRDALFVRQDPVAPGEGLLWSAVCGKPLLSAGGDDLGHLTDLVLDAAGAVTGYLASHGVLDDLFSGPVLLGGPVDLTPGAEAVMVNTPAESGQQEGSDALS